jgi:hypothetical protein
MTKPFRLTAKQVEANRLLGSDATNVLLRGGSRSGKTFLIVRAVCIRAMKAKSRHAIWRYRFNHVKASIWQDTLPKVMSLCFPAVPLERNETDLIATFPNGSQFWLGGLDDKARVEKVLGQEYSTLYFNEASQIPWASVETSMSRLAENSGLKLRAYSDCNPPSKLHWTYQLFKAGMKPGTKELLPDPGDYAEMQVNPIDNVENLPPKYFDILAGMSEAKRLRFERGEWASEVAGALWTMEDRIAGDGKIIPGIDSARVAEAPPLARVVVAIDPSGASGGGDGDDIGIIVAGKGFDGRAYVLADRTCNLSPNGWALQAVRAYQEFQADRIVAEKNFGGAMVESVIRTASKDVPVKLVTASRGKVARAEPVAALYEQCIAGGQVVETERGSVVIEDVVAGDRVWTRQGLRRVLWSGQTGTRETMLLHHDHGTLECTPDHPVFCQRGFIDAGLIVPETDMLLAWDNSNIHASHAPPPSGSQRAIVNRAPLPNGGKLAHPFGLSSSLMAFAISRTRKVIGALPGMVVGDCSIALSGPRSMVRSLMDTISIISTTIWAITTSPIWNRSIPANMPSITTSLRSSSATMLVRGFHHPSEPAGGALNPGSTHATNAAPNFKAGETGFGSAHLPATRNIGIVSVEKSGRTLPVYNLHVEGCHEFFAGGVLVHNCRVSHVGSFPDLEDQMGSFTGEGYMGDGSPDRVDVTVWALSELMLGGSNYDDSLSWV